MGHAWLLRYHRIWGKRRQRGRKAWLQFFFSSQIPGGESSAGEEKYKEVEGNEEEKMVAALQEAMGSYRLQASA